MVKETKDSNLHWFLEAIYAGGYTPAGDAATVANAEGVMVEAVKNQFPIQKGKQILPYETTLYEHIKTMNHSIDQVTQLEVGIEYDQGDIPSYFQNLDFLKLATRIPNTVVESGAIVAPTDNTVLPDTFTVTIDGGTPIVCTFATSGIGSTMTMLHALNEALVNAGVTTVFAYISAATKITLACIDGTGNTVITDTTTALADDYKFAAGPHNLTGKIVPSGSVLQSFMIHWDDLEDEFESYGCNIVDWELDFSDNWIQQNILIDHRSSIDGMTNFTTNLGFLPNTSTGATNGGNKALRKQDVQIRVDAVDYEVQGGSVKVRNMMDEQVQDTISNGKRNQNKIEDRKIEITMTLRSHTNIGTLQALKEAGTEHDIIFLFDWDKDGDFTDTQADGSLTLKDMVCIKLNKHELPEYGFYEFEATWEIGELTVGQDRIQIAKVA